MNPSVSCISVCFWLRVQGLGAAAACDAGLEAGFCMHYCPAKTRQPRISPLWRSWTQTFLCIFMPPLQGWREALTHMH